MSIKCKEGVHHSYISCICYHMMAFSNLRRHQHKTLFAGVCRRLSTMFPRLFGSYKVIFTKKLFFVKCKKILSQSFKCCVFCARVEDSRLNPGHVLKTKCVHVHLYNKCKLVRDDRERTRTFWKTSGSSSP